MGLINNKSVNDVCQYDQYLFMNIKITFLFLFSCLILFAILFAFLFAILLIVLITIG